MVVKVISDLKLRWFILLLVCLLGFANNYAYDIPAATLNQMEIHFLGNNSVEVDDDGTNAHPSEFQRDYNLLYSLYSFPNVILPLFSGILADKIGIRSAGILFTSLLVAGSSIFAIYSDILSTGAFCNLYSFIFNVLFLYSLIPASTFSYFFSPLSLEAQTLSADSPHAWPVAWFGRIIYGFGGESQSVVQSVLCSKFFSGKELAFSLGLNLAVARVGSVVNDAVSVRIASNYNFYWAAWLGAFICGASLLAAFIIFFVDRKAEDIILENNGFRARVRRGLCGGRKNVEAEISDDEESLIPQPPKEEIHLKAILKFPPIFWVLCVSCITVYIAILPFNSIAAGFIAQKWLVDVPMSQVSEDEKDHVFVEANNIMMITYLCGLCAPAFGAIVDIVGRRAYLTLFASLSVTAVHCILAFTDAKPAGLLVWLGISYAIYASALWPSIALVIPEAYHATGYGIVTAIQNFGLAVAPLIVGTLMPSSDCKTYHDCVASYEKVEIFFLASASIGVVSGIILNFCDFVYKPYPVLNISAKEAERRKTELAIMEGDKEPLLMDN